MGQFSLFQCLNLTFSLETLGKGRRSLDYIGLESGGSFLYDGKPDSVGKKTRKALD